jgi:hypothetical protein
MKVTQFSTSEAAATGFTHVINLKVTGSGTGDLPVAASVVNVMPVIPGTWVKDVALDVKTAYNGLTAPAVNMGVGASGSNNTSLLNGVAVNATGYSASSSGVVVNSASQFVTVTQAGTGSNASTGELNIFLRLIDLSKGRNTFAA